MHALCQGDDGSLVEAMGNAYKRLHKFCRRQSLVGIDIDLDSSTCLFIDFDVGLYEDELQVVGSNF